MLDSDRRFEVRSSSPYFESERSYDCPPARRPSVRELTFFLPEASRSVDSLNNETWWRAGGFRGHVLGPSNHGSTSLPAYKLSPGPQQFSVSLNSSYSCGLIDFRANRSALGRVRASKLVIHRHRWGQVIPKRVLRTTLLQDQCTNRLIRPVLPITLPLKFTLDLAVQEGQEEVVQATTMAVPVEVLRAEAAQDTNLAEEDGMIRLQRD